MTRPGWAAGGAAGGAGDSAIVLGLDLGGTQIRAAAISAAGERLGRRSAETPSGGGPEPIYAACTDLLRGVLADLSPACRAMVAAIGLSSMGPVDPWRGVVVDPPNVTDLRDAPLADELEERLGLPAYLDRDTNVAALAEHWLGAARGCRDFMYITVSTGLGGAIWCEDRLLLGPDGTAGEIGHVCLMPVGGPRCGCGGIGHLEAIASGSGLAGAAQDALESQVGRTVRAATATGATTTGGATTGATNAGATAPSRFLAARAALGRITGRDVAEGELAGDETCAALMERARKAFAIACVGWVNAFNPERIVVGGTLAERQGARWLEPARVTVATTALRGPAGHVSIVPAELGADVGVVGAWPLVRERHGVPLWRERRARP